MNSRSKIDGPHQTLNQRSYALCQRMIARQAQLRIQLVDDDITTPMVDCGIDVSGSLQAGIAVSEICMAGLGAVTLESCSDLPFPIVRTATDQPLQSCLHAQYAGWMIQGDEYFAMGSGPMRAAAAKEELFDELDGQENTDEAVGVLESRQLPPTAVRAKIASDCDVDPRKLVLLVAPTASLVGAMQIVARSVETAMHKLHELKFDVASVKSGIGTAPLPPVGGKSGKDDAVAMGRTNDAILYGADVTLWCDTADATLEQLLPNIPSSASADYGRPFAELFAAYDHEFYKIDKLLFSPALITLVNLNSGRSFRAGRLDHAILLKSFGA